MSQRFVQNPWLTDVFTTTDATVTTSSGCSFVVPSGASGDVEFHVNARNTATGATMSMRVIQTFKNVSGTLSIVGTIATIMAAAGDVAMITATIGVIRTGTTVQPQVTGIVATNIEWLCSAKYNIN